ncbi:AMP-binding protein [Microbacterium sp. 16-032]|uniref:AMP-binding protein n=1 Tax=Microbacterium sp. 16-032 TaxID=3239808 RepID=UPI0034E2621F
MTEAPLVCDVLRAAAVQDPDRVLVADEHRSLTAAELWDYTSKLLGVLSARDVVVGDRVAVIARRDAATVRLVIGLLATGRVPLVIDPARDDIGHRLERARPVLVLDEREEVGLAPRAFDEEVLAGAPGDPRPPARDAAAYLIFTSGTTAMAKGVVTTQRGLAHAAVDWLAVYGVPAGHSGGRLQFAGTGFDVFYSDVVRALTGRYRLFICPEEVRLDPARLVALLRKERIDMVELTPAVGALVLNEIEATGLGLPDLRQLAFGGEAWRVAQYRRALRLLPGRRIMNTYGLVETTVDNFVFDPGDALSGVPDEQIMAIGRPFPGCDVMLVDPETGVATTDEGELWIGGAYVAAGYLDEEGRMTPDALVVDVDVDEHGEDRPWFRTGDVARRDSGGTYWYVGRIGSVVKLHGQRVDLDAVDAIVSRSTGGGTCVTVLLDDQETLVTVVVARPDVSLDADEVRAVVTRELGPLATPSRVLRLPELPLNPNGKVDRRATAMLASSFHESGGASMGEAIAGAGGVGEPLAAMTDFCRRELGLERVHDDVPVAELGLDSLRVVRLLAMLGREYRCRLPVELVFSGPTLAEIAAQVEARRGQEGIGAPRRSRTGYPLTHAQQELLVHGALLPDPAVYVVPLVLQITGTIEPARIEAALQAVVAAHEPLHSRYLWSEEGWRAELTEPRLTLAVLDDGDDVSQESLLATPFDLASEPPIRAWLLPDGPGRRRLIVAMHHVATDGGSGQLFIDQLVEELRMPGATAAPTPGFGDLASEQVAPSEADLGYWRDLLAGVVAGAPRDPARKGFAHRFRRALGRGLTRELRAAAHAHGCTTFAVMLAALSECERRWSDSEDVLIGYPVSRRESAAAEPLIGMFIDTVACRVRVPPALTARAMIEKVRDQLAANGRHLGPACQQVLQEQTRGSGRPAFSCWLNHLGAKERVPPSPGLSAKVVETDQLGAIFDRTFYVYDDEDGIEIIAVAAAGVPRAVAESRLDQLLRMIARVVRYADEPLADADLSDPLAPVARVAPRPAERVLPFAASARRRPESTALLTSAGITSYGELAHAVAAYRCDDTMLEMTRSVEGVVALLAGLCRPGLTALWDPAQPEAWRDAYGAAIRETAVPDDDVARYCLPSSGSSGAPRAVVSDVDTLLHVLEDYLSALNVTPSDRFLLTAGLAHDPVLRDILAPLLVGASVSIPDRRQWHDPRALVDVIRTSSPTVLNLTPQLARLLVAAAGGTVLESVTRIVLSGDVLRADDISILRRAFPAATLFHGYGLTQTPQLIALQPLTDDLTEPLIGPARPGAKLLVIDREGRPCGLGQPGEIVVHGQLLASGIPAPVIEPAREDGDRPVRMLATGDRGELVGDGLVRYLGRVTDLVSVNGQLFDPGGVDRLLTEHPAVADSATLLATDNGHDRLVSAVVVRGDGVTELELKRRLRRQLPIGLIPARIATMPSIPRGVNGKVDRQALRERLQSAAIPVAQSLPPQTETERAVARIWQRHLRVPAVGIHDNFFDLGGTSLLLLHVHADLGRRWTQLPDVLTFYERPTVAGLAAEIDAGTTGSVEPRGHRQASRRAERDRRMASRRAVSVPPGSEG